MLRRALTTAAAVVLTGSGASAHAIELDHRSSFQLAGAGGEVAGAGDVNGDGVADLVLGDPELPGGRGGAYVFFGRGALGRVDVASRGSGRIRITGAREGDEAGARVASAGDVNGDGLADVLVTASRAEPFSRRVPGRRFRIGVEGAAYVVYGSRSAADVDLGAMGERGIVIKGIGDGDAAGAGDVNGDGFADVVVGGSSGSAEPAHVVFGGGPAGSLDVADLGSRGFAIEPSSGDLGFGSAVDGAGDIDGDGLAEVVIGAPASLGRPLRDDDGEVFGPGAAYVVRGARDGADVDVTRPVARVTRIEPDGFGLLGYAVAGVGDVNGDGLPDVAVGAPMHGVDFRRRRPGPGAAWVVFGRRELPARVDLRSLAANGLRIEGRRAGDGVGGALAGGDDVTGDALPDILVGAPYDPFRDEPAARSGAAYLLTGSGRSGAVGVDAALELAGTPGSAAGESAALPGDVDADGVADVVVAAPGTCTGARRSHLSRELAGHPGAEVVSEGLVYGYPPSAPPPPRRAPGTPGADRIAGGGGHDHILAGEGDDFAVGAGGLDCLFGESGDDRLDGGDGGDALLGGPGADRLRGGPGYDALQGGAGDDVLAGADREDTLVGGAGADRLSGGGGADELLGDGGRDRLSGGDGDDDLRGGAAADRIRGEHGRDALDGGRGTDAIDAGTGNDHVYDHAGADLIRGGRGNDRVDVRDRDRDRVECGAGRDVAVVDRRDVTSGCEVVRRPARRRRGGAA